MTLRERELEEENARLRLQVRELFNILDAIILYLRSLQKGIDNQNRYTETLIERYRSKLHDNP